MTFRAKIKLAIKAIKDYANGHYGWSAKLHAEDKEIFDALMEIAAWLEMQKEKKDEHDAG